MRDTSICLLVVAGLLGGCAAGPEQGTLSAFADGPSDGLDRLAADIEAHGEIDTALGLYKQAAELTPDASAYVRLGKAYTRTGRIDPAIGAFRSALRRDADNLDAMLGLGSALVRKRALTDAIVILEKAAALGEIPGILNQLGLAQTLAGRFAAGRDSLERASRLDPTDLDILSNLALAEALVGHCERAIELASLVVQSGAAQHHTRSAVVTLVLAGPTGLRQGDRRSQSDPSRRRRPAQSGRRDPDDAVARSPRSGAGAPHRLSEAMAPGA
jgi:Flp pilus assembly protein TadD